MKTATGAGGGDEFMDYDAAVDAVLERAGRIILPGDPVDVVTMAEHEFARDGTCDVRFMQPIENAMRECLQAWTPAQKRSIWRSTEPGQEYEAAPEDEALDDSLDSQYVDLSLEGELLHHIIERLAGGGPNDQTRDEDEPW